MPKTIVQWTGRSQPFQNKMMSALKNVTRNLGTGDVQVGVDMKARVTAPRKRKG